MKVSTRARYGIRALIDIGITGNNGPVLVKDIAAVLNSHSRENTSNFPDFVLAAYLLTCLEAFETAIEKRELLGTPGVSGE